MTSKKDTKHWNLRIPFEIYRRMQKYDEINWPVVLRKMLATKLDELDKHWPEQ